ncbi:WD40 repeat-like protein [Lojkania enalia]|uniref:WD40 repeat-like protein n=1 Tax=Lojkania enalia TaxID=147567 RepID=A0A9P4K6K1_9PLEO|nr:WD40 repeat-like protein [Didymosphaeria enalia]
MPSQFPINHNLFIATPNAINLHGSSTKKLLFRCASQDGIVNAQAAKDNSGLLAVANSHLVLLHDIARGKDREYKLKNGDGEARLLLFSPDSRILYFTTSLNLTIQAYSIPTAELLAPLHAHPSPPNVLAISRVGDVLLSASPNPPTIYLQDLRVSGRQPVRFHPIHATSPVTCAAFRDVETSSGKPSSILLLGFQDGSLGLYKVEIPAFRSIVDIEHIYQAQVAQMRQPIELSVLRRLHKPSMGGISAVEFIPGHRSRIISVGHDGRCRIINFEDGGKVLRTWHVFGSVTSLAIHCSGTIRSMGREDITVLINGDATEDAANVHETMEILIAIGTRGGKVQVFNVLGLLIHDITVRAPIISLDWVGDMSEPSVLPSRHISPVGPTCPPPRLVLDIPLDQHEDGTDEGLGTIRRTRVPKDGTRYDPIPIKVPTDLFSSPPTSPLADRIYTIPLQTSKVTDDPRPTKASTPKLRKTYTRPRILTQTFTSPSLDSNAVFPARPSTIHPARPSLPTKLSTHLNPQLCEEKKSIISPPSDSPSPHAETLMSGALPTHQSPFSSLRSPSPDMWVTPPSQPHASIATPPRSSSGITSPKRSIAFEPALFFSRSESPDFCALPASRFPRTSRDSGWKVRGVRGLDGTDRGPNSSPMLRKRWRCSKVKGVFKRGKKEGDGRLARRDLLADGVDALRGVRNGNKQDGYRVMEEEELWKEMKELKGEVWMLREVVLGHGDQESGFF